MENTSNDMGKRELTDRINGIETMAKLIEEWADCPEKDDAEFVGISYIITSLVSPMRRLLEFGAKLTEGEIDSDGS